MNASVGDIWMVGIDLGKGGRTVLVAGRLAVLTAMWPGAGSFTALAIDTLSYAAWPAPCPDIPDDRHNPKQQGIWFADFLRAIVPEQIRSLLVPAEPLRHVQARNRNGPQSREWKMKTWKQVHQTT